MRARAGELTAGSPTLAGAAALLASLFLPWSHQVPSGGVSAIAGAAPTLATIPRDPTGWQVYSAADVLFALLAGALVVAATAGGRRLRLWTFAGVALALAFALHALAVPPSDGAALLGAAGMVRAGVGESIALIALGLSLAGLGLSFAAASPGRSGG